MTVIAAPGRTFTALLHNAGEEQLVFESADDAPERLHMRILFKACASEPPSGLTEIRRIRSEGLAAGAREYVLEAVPGEHRLLARSVHVHESVAPGSRNILELSPPPRVQRWLWRLSLWALRVPGVFRLVASARGRRG